MLIEYIIRSVAMYKRKQEVTLSVLLRICEYFHCDIGDICEVLEKTNKDLRNGYV